MRLKEEEIFALSKLFCENNDLDCAVSKQMNSAEVIERKETGVGFFSTIRLPLPPPDSHGSMQRGWTFQHQKCGSSGSFFAFFEPPNLIELEAVVHDGNWPVPFDSKAFVAT